MLRKLYDLTPLKKGVISTEQGSLTKSTQKIGAQVNCIAISTQLKMKLQKNIKRQAIMVISHKFLFKPKGLRNTKKPSPSHLYLIRYQTIPNIKQKSRTHLPQCASTASQPWRRNTVCLTPNWILCLLLYAAVQICKTALFSMFFVHCKFKKKV